MYDEVYPLICAKPVTNYLENREIPADFTKFEKYYGDRSALEAIKLRYEYYNGVKYMDKISTKRQLEKDETYWTASTFVSLFESDHCVEILKKLLIKNFGEIPPISGAESWDDLLGEKEDIQLIFEAVVPAPIRYRNFLIKASGNRILIPYMMQQLKPGCLHSRTSAFEGPTHIDAVIINPTTYITIFIEAKVLSDISHSITYDVTRNQIARNLDVMLTAATNINVKGKEDEKTSHKINVERTLFLLLTPRIFKENPGSRLYGYKMREYKENPLKIKADLIHRKDITDWNAVADRIGWTTWEEIWEIGDKYNAMGKEKIFMRNFPNIIETCHDCVSHSF